MKLSFDITITQAATFETIFAHALVQLRIAVVVAQHRTCSIVLVGDSTEASAVRRATRALVAEGPDGDTGVVAIALHHRTWCVTYHDRTGERDGA